MKWLKSIVVMSMGAVLFCLSATAQSRKQAVAAVYQYEAPAGSKKAYLWIPPKCKQVNGLVISFSNLLERNWLEDPIIRNAAARQNLGVLLIEISTDGITPQLRPAEQKIFLQLLKQLANLTGYPEIEHAPFIPIEHSIHSVFCWNLATWLPNRTIAAIPVKGLVFPADVSIAGIPMCYLIGENDEWPAVKDGKPWQRDYVWPQIRHSAALLRAANENNLMGVATDPGGGHLDWSAKLSKLMALFIEKACTYRLTINTDINKHPSLKVIDPKAGWLTDTAGLDADRFPPAPHNQYKGDKAAAYWFFDKEMAMAAKAFAGDRKPRKKQMVSFVQQDTVVALAGKPFVVLDFKPDKSGINFTVKCGFFKTIPYDFVDGGKPLGYAQGKVDVRVVSGPAIQLSADTFQLAFNRSAKGGDVWLQATQAGDDEYSKAVQPAQLKIPSVLTEGTPQYISFPKIEDQQLDRLASIKLHAVSSAGLPVKYFVESGPAFILNNILHFTPIPLKSKYPVKVVVTAWQWGRMDFPKVQSATMVSQTFNISK